MRPIKTILVPTDFSAGAERALAYARDVADAFGASFHLLHVFENPLAAGAFMDMYTPAAPEYLDRLERQARTQLEGLLTDVQKDKYSPVFATRMGGPIQGILDYVREHGAIDLIVLGTSDRGPVARLMLGSVADRLVRSAPCPVLTVHLHDRSEAGQQNRAA